MDPSYKKVSNRSHRTEEYITVLKNTLEGFKNRLDETEENINQKQGSKMHQIRAAKIKI